MRTRPLPFATLKFSVGINLLLKNGGGGGGVMIEVMNGEGECTLEVFSLSTAQVHSSCAFFMVGFRHLLRHGWRVTE